jgi:hypothetical protein
LQEIFGVATLFPARLRGAAVFIAQLLDCSPKPVGLSGEVLFVVELKNR